MHLITVLYWLGWVGDFFALLGSYFVGCDDLVSKSKGWRCFLMADLSLIGLPLYLRAWNLAFLYAVFLILGIRGILKSRKPVAIEGKHYPACNERCGDDGSHYLKGSFAESCTVANCGICK